MYPVILSGLGITVVNSKPSQCKVDKNPNLPFYVFILIEAKSVLSSKYFSN